jgi:hypothetical protein
LEEMWEQSKEVEEREVDEREVSQETPAEMHAKIKADAVAVALTKLAVARKHRNGVKLQLAELRGARERMMSEQAAKRQTTDLKDVDLGGISTEMRRLRQLDDAAVENIHVISDMIVESEETLLEIDRKITKLALKVEKSCLAKQRTSNSAAWAWNDVILHLEVGRESVSVKVCVCVRERERERERESMMLTLSRAQTHTHVHCRSWRLTTTMLHRKTLLNPIAQVGEILWGGAGSQQPKMFGRTCRRSWI